MIRNFILKKNFKFHKEKIETTLKKLNKNCYRIHVDSWASKKKDYYVNIFSNHCKIQS